MSTGSPELIDRLRREIARTGPISFRRFMELALYDSDHGYYSTGAGRPGPGGDFVTASDAGRDFGRCLARQLREFDELLGEPDPFVLVEVGAGRGLLARDTLDAAREREPSFADRLSLLLVDRSPAMRAEAARRVPEATVAESVGPLAAPAGCVVAVELFDALPVHRVRRRGGRLVEVGVGVDAAGELVEVETAPAEAVAELAARHGAAAEEGYEAEVCPELEAVLAGMTAGLGRGFVVIVDYGEEASRLYGPAHRRGTLLAYHRHATSEEYLARVGRQDLTAHVNFTALATAARALGLHVLGRTTQDRFLISNGLLEAFEPAGDPGRLHDPRRVKRRLQAMQLIHPQAMGRRFQVLLLAKGVAPEAPPRGLRDPFA